MKRPLIRVPPDQRRTALDREVVEAGTTALKRSAIILERLESMVKRATGRQTTPGRGDRDGNEEES
jgi:hypothetical protein